MNDFRPNLPRTSDQTRAENEIENLRRRGGIFVEAVRETRMPMLVTDPTLPGNPVVFANEAFLALSGYTLDEVLGQEPHFMDGPLTDAGTIRELEDAIAEGRDATLEILQHRKDGSTFWTALFVGPRRDGHGRVAYHLLSFLDITRRREAEDGMRRLAADLERRVEARTRELAAANDRLSLLVREVDHRAKNSLAIASSLLSMQAQRQADPAARAAFYETRARLTAMARAHDMLSRSSGTLDVALAEYLRGLCSALAQSEGDRLAVSLDVQDGIMVDADRAIALGLVINELVTNAVKHAFPPPRTGAVEVSVRRCEGNRVQLRVRDDGIGMAEAKGGSLGHLIVANLVEQIGGEMSVVGGDGVCVTIIFPA
jgi:PAS domain S-box-containing protein